MDKPEGFWRYWWRAGRWAIRQTATALKGRLSLAVVASVVGVFLVSLWISGWSVAVAELMTAGLAGLVTGAVFLALSLVVNAVRAPTWLAAEAMANYRKLENEVAPLQLRQNRQDALNQLTKRREFGVDLFSDGGLRASDWVSSWERWTEETTAFLHEFFSPATASRFRNLGVIRARYVGGRQDVGRQRNILAHQLEFLDEIIGTGMAD